MASVPERILLVEGPDDEHVIWHICRRHGDLASFEIRQTGGIDNLLDAIEAETKAAGRQSVGLLVDANSNLDDRWRSLRDRLHQLDIVPPETLDEEGCIIPGHPRLGLWLMPDNWNAGELEDFVRTLIPEDDPVWPLAMKYIDEISPEHREFSESKVLRAQIHAWLAARKEPRQMGSAIGTGELSADGELAVRLVTWLRSPFRRQ